MLNSHRPAEFNVAPMQTKMHKQRTEASAEEEAKARAEARYGGKEQKDKAQRQTQRIICKVAEATRQGRDKRLGRRGRGREADGRGKRQRQGQKAITQKRQRQRQKGQGKGKDAKAEGMAKRQSQEENSKEADARGKRQRERQRGRCIGEEAAARGKMTQIQRRRQVTTANEHPARDNQKLSVSLYVFSQPLPRSLYLSMCVFSLSQPHSPKRHGQGTESFGSGSCEPKGRSSLRKARLGFHPPVQFEPEIVDA